MRWRGGSLLAGIPLGVLVARAALPAPPTALGVGGAALAIGGAADWGESTGISLTRDGTQLILGQRRTTGAGVEERLLEVTLDCS